MNTATAGRPARPARPACCHSDAQVPGQPAISTASRPGMFTPSSSAVVAAIPVIRPSRRPASSSRRSSGRYPDRYEETLRAPRSPRASSATDSAPLRERVKASAGTPALTSSDSKLAASAVTARRARSPGRVCSSGGSQSANVSGARGELSAVTGTASSPVSSRAQRSGSAIVADARTNTGPGAPCR
jgi:hypothetical protein